MPTYQYQCTECGEGLEAVQKFTDDALTVCPNCEGRLKKVFSAVGIVFKGSGFYRNDSRGSSSSSTPAVGVREGVRFRCVDFLDGVGLEVVHVLVRRCFLFLVVVLRVVVERYVGRLSRGTQLHTSSEGPADPIGGALGIYSPASVIAW